MCLVGIILLGFYIFIHSNSLCLLILLFSYNIIIDVVGLPLSLYYLSCFSSFFCPLSPLFAAFWGIWFKKHFVSLSVLPVPLYVVFIKIIIILINNFPLIVSEFYWPWYGMYYLYIHWKLQQCYIFCCK